MMVPCVDCVPCDCSWPVGAVAAVGWESWGTPCWGCSGGMTGDVGGMGQGLPGAVCTEDTLAGQLKLECRLWCPGVLSSGGTPAGGLEPR